MSDSLSKLLEEMPEFLSSKHLVELGLFRNPDAAYLARQRGSSPDYFKMGRKIVYPKSKVIEFINNLLMNGSTPRSLG